MYRYFVYSSNFKGDTYVQMYLHNDNLVFLCCAKYYGKN